MYETAKQIIKSQTVESLKCEGWAVSAVDQYSLNVSAVDQYSLNECFWYVASGLVRASTCITWNDAWRSSCCAPVYRRRWPLVPHRMQVRAVEQVAAVPVPMYVVVPQSVRVPLSSLRMPQGVQMALKALPQQGLKLSLPKYVYRSSIRKSKHGTRCSPHPPNFPRYLRMCREMKMGLSENHIYFVCAVR